MSLDNKFKPVVALQEKRFDIWKVLSSYKDEPDIMITFNALEGNEKYACIRLDKLLEILYNNNQKENNNG